MKTRYLIVLGIVVALLVLIYRESPAYTITGKLEGDFLPGGMGVELYVINCGEPLLLQVRIADEDRDFTFDNLDNNTYTVIPRPQQILFDPPYRMVTIDNNTVEDVNFTSTAVDFTYLPEQREVVISGGSVTGVDFISEIVGPYEMKQFKRR